MTSAAVQRDERTLAVENESYRWAYYVLAYGLLAIAAYRSYVAHEAAWDLMALVIIGGSVAWLYQWTHDVLTKRSYVGAVAAMILAALVAAAIVWLLVR